MEKSFKERVLELLDAEIASSEKQFHHEFHELGRPISEVAPTGAQLQTEKRIRRLIEALT